MGTKRLNPDELRTKFVLALSEMYRQEVPLYGDLVDIVHRVDTLVLEAESKSPASLPTRHELERHGAIRLGTEHELRTLRRLFKLFGMYPVGCYDLSVVDFPLYATAFRPTTEESLKKNPFRVFTTLLRRDQLSPEIRAMAESILEQRNLFTSRLLDIIDRVESTQFMASQDAEDLITDALKIFKWHSKSTVSMEQYLSLKQEHPMVADIVCFPSAHINHLTPRTLDINLVQEEMIRRGLPAKDTIEGPPIRQCPILLRQTSFKALKEQVAFTTTNGASVNGTHTARFGEVEQRGAAVTPRGRVLYDRLLNLSRHEAATAHNGAQSRDFETILVGKFTEHYPDSWAELQAQSLVYFRYQLTTAGHCVSDGSELLQQSVGLNRLLSLGLVEYEPITYEDFLPFSAAGIFTSNIGNGPVGATEPTACQENGTVNGVRSSYRESFEHALGCKVLDEFELYAALESESINECKKELKLKDILRN